jgi:geranylgeranyl reductase family protein
VAQTPQPVPTTGSTTPSPTVLTEPPAGAIVLDADVVVVGAGPAGSTTAAYLAQAGVDVVVLEKSAFPREKVCGDGLTPRAVRQLVRLGIDTSAQAGWLRNKGLRILGGGMRLELPWPELASFPDYGLVRPRTDFDQLLARHAAKLGAVVHERTPVSAPLIDDRTGRVVGVVATAEGERPLVVRGSVVVAADGNSGRLALAVGRDRLPRRPMGVAYRRYYASRRHDDTWLESWLELRDGGRLLPGYGWIFGMGDGTSNVGVGILNTSSAFRNIDYRALLRRWVAGMPAEWGITEETAQGPIRGAALPMGFTRKPQYADGLLLVGDAAGMINPCNGEGIAYAMESGAAAAEIIVQALAKPTGAARERTLRSYPRVLAEQYGGYYTLGRWFVQLIGKPGVMRFLTRHGLPHPQLMRFTLKFLANLTDPRDGDAMDRIINAASRWAPAA